MSFEEKLENYADLAVRVGVNVQEGQDVVIQAPIHAVEFVRLVAKKAYQAGAKRVHFRWSDDELVRTHYLLAPEETFSEFPEWDALTLNTLAERKAAFIHFNSPNPEMLEGVDPKRLSANSQASGKALETLVQGQMSHKVPWTILSIPSEKWAEKVFPDLDPKEGVEKLWEVVFKMTRADLENPVKAWEDHFNTLNQNSRRLNTIKYKKLHYKAPGTDLSIGFHPKHVWVPNDLEQREVSFAPNIPTEELFTLPDKMSVNGTVASTMPLNYNGTLIEGISVTFKDGRIVDYSATKGYEMLKSIIETDEGSHYLGEVALVAQDSPIAQSGLIFYNTLYDENASCHLAIGRAYPTFEDADTASKEELESRGMNNSVVHVDFMIGSNELNIDGETEDGTIEPILRNGLWVK
ncbi:aminopeptidase [Pullulanibacillus sp. KACC 23026]|uniref:aminopeptidase n=1 Tax=Pullulanibacillus sp. KACC 23026 TaxID=3028315 RepID=UPI0023B0B565|nr:aminopeptidase [Pullulanibacillus sp. KACC 23026]WEG15018.1 aminopeptidase [Pullulanibacillus sp. KACC 23026]